MGGWCLHLCHAHSTRCERGQSAERVQSTDSQHGVCAILACLVLLALGATQVDQLGRAQQSRTAPGWHRALAPALLTAVPLTASAVGPAVLRCACQRGTGLQLCLRAARPFAHRKLVISRQWLGLSLPCCQGSSLQGSCC